MLVQGEGFEPPKAEPDDLQSPVFDRFTIPARFALLYHIWSRRQDSNLRPAVYKTAALPAELRRHDGTITDVSVANYGALDNYALGALDFFWRRWRFVLRFFEFLLYHVGF